MKIALATDHAGFDKLKEFRSYLESLGHECVDYGPKELDPADDYPDFIFPAAKAVAAGGCEVGFIMGGSGEGEIMAANRIKGVRCGLFYGPAKAVEAVDIKGGEASDDFEILRLNRRHNKGNMLSFGARFVDMENMKKAAKIWLDTEYEGGRHDQRIAKLDEV
jgi:ribose 5-phosphate isomerase B